MCIRIRHAGQGEIEKYNRVQSLCFPWRGVITVRKRKYEILILVSLLSLLSGCQSAGVKTYSYYFYESTCDNMNIMISGMEVPIEFDDTRSNPEALNALDALKWNVLYPNSKGGIELSGVYDPETGNFVLHDWFLKAPFEYRVLEDEENVPHEFRHEMKGALGPEDFESLVENPGRYNQAD